VPKYAKVTLQPASGTALTPGGPPLTQLIQVENSAQGTKPSEWRSWAGGSSSGSRRRYRVGCRGGGGSAVLSPSPPRFRACTLPLPSRHSSSPSAAAAVALKLKLVYALAGGSGEQVTEVTDVRNFPPTL
jgi:hypothetical protein